MHMFLYLEDVSLAPDVPKLTRHSLLVDAELNFVGGASFPYFPLPVQPNSSIDNNIKVCTFY